MIFSAFSSRKIGPLFAERHVDVWEFASVVVRAPSGEVVYPCGEELLGRLVYTRSEHMPVLLMCSGRPKFALDDPPAGADEEKVAAFESLDA